MPNCEALHRSDFYCYSFNGVSADYASYGSPMPMRRNLVQCSVVYDTTISNIYALNDTFNGAGNTGSFVGAIGTTVANTSGNELEVSSTTVYPVISSTISTTTGKEYIVSADLNGMSFSPGYIASVLFEVIEGGVTVASQSSTAPGNFNFTYTAGAGSASVRYTFVLTPNPGPPPPPPMAPFSFTLDNAMVYFIDTNISSETVCVSKSGYRYGFNGIEKVDEISGEGNGYDFRFRDFNSQICRFISIDPLSRQFTWLSTYQFAGNTPIQAIDLEGLEIYYSQAGVKLGQYGTSTEIRVVNDDQLEKTIKEFEIYKKALEIDPNATNEFLSGILLTTGSVAYKEYFTSVQDVTKGAKVVPYVNNCFDAAKKQMEQQGLTPSGPGKDALQAKVDNEGQKKEGKPTLIADPIGASIYTMTQLKKGNPVMVGVQEPFQGVTNSANNVNVLTGHFVVIVSCTVSTTGEVTFGYLDNASAYTGNNPDNQFLLNQATGSMEDKTNLATGADSYTVTEVRQNSKKKTKKK